MNLHPELKKKTSSSAGLTALLTPGPATSSDFEWPPSSLPHRRTIKEPTQFEELDSQEEEGETDYLRLILNARVYDVAIETPLTYAIKLSAKTGNQIYLKREDLQPIFSFKCRGAYNRMYRLTAEEKARGVCCASAGNHAQGVALAAQKLGVKATIIMPTFAPQIKVDNVRRLGGNVVLFGNDFDEAKKECIRQSKENSLTFIPPFDDMYVIAGQGTVGVEILRQMKQDRLDAIFVCCGGGGLIAGIAAYVKRIRPEIKIIGVNAIDSDGMYQSLLKGSPVEVKEVGLFADGTAVKLPGKECVRLARKFVYDMVLVSTDEICAAIKDAFDDTRSVLEPAGALAIAGCKKYLGSHPEIKNGVFVAVSSGANMNFDRLRFVAERAKMGEGQECLFSVLIPERPGALRELYHILAPRTVTELSYRYSDTKKAHVMAAFEIKEGQSEVQLVLDAIIKKGWEVLNISDNEMAKTHARFLAGGRSNTAENELLYRFRFPEKPGALSKFLDELEKDWNVSLFHYRNLGGDLGRVLAGLQVPESSKKTFEDFVETLGKAGYISIINETDNPVYKHFLR